jgi:hypothetical protein
MPFSSLIGTNLAQLGWTYTAVNGFVRGLYIRDKLIAVRQDNSGGYKFFQVFGTTLATVTQNWVRSAELSQIIMNGTIQRFWPVMLLKYKKGTKGSNPGEKPQDILTPAFKGNIRYWVFAYPVIVLPSLLAAVWVFACRALNRIDKNMEFFMLSARDRTGNR